MAVTSRTKSRKKNKKLFYRIFTIVIVSVMAGGILLAALLSRLY